MARKSHSNKSTSTPKKGFRARISVKLKKRLTVQGYLNLTPRENAAYQKATKTLAIMREGDLSLTKAAKAAGTTPRTVATWAKRDISKVGNHYRLTRKQDNRYRTMNVLTSEGVEKIVVRGSRDAALVRGQRDAFLKYRQNGDPSVFDRFKGKQVGVGQNKVTLLTDIDVIKDAFDSGELDLVSVYEVSNA
jgi:hypothetical protein